MKLEAKILSFLKHYYWKRQVNCTVKTCMHHTRLFVSHNEPAVHIKKLGECIRERTCCEASVGALGTVELIADMFRAQINQKTNPVLLSYIENLTGMIMLL